MHINNLETFKGLINKFDLDDGNQLKVSSMYNFFEEATGFTSSLLNKKIDSKVFYGRLPLILFNIFLVALIILF